jgi:hypothetical protein
MRRWLRLVAFLICLPVCCACQQTKHGTVPNSPVSLCEVLKSPAAFAGKTISVDVHISSMKEGSRLSSPDCATLGVVLVTTLDGGPDSGIVGLRKELSQYQRASKPILAILDGVYIPDFLDDVRHRRYPVFKAYSARNVRRSSSPERR